MRNSVLPISLINMPYLTNLAVHDICRLPYFYSDKYALFNYSYDIFPAIRIITFLSTMVGTFPGI